MPKLPVDRRAKQMNAPAAARDEGMNQASWALSYLISGVLFWGGLGWLADHFLHTHVMVGVGIVLGAGLGCYLIVKRFGATTAKSDVVADDGPDPGAGLPEVTPAHSDRTRTKGMNEK